MTQNSGVILRLCLKLLQLDVFPLCRERALAFANPVNLKADVAFGVGFENLLIAEIADEDSVEPGSDIGALGDDTEVIPLTVLKIFVRDELILWGEPATTSGFAIDVSCFRTIFSTCFGFDLGAVEPTTVLVLIAIFQKRADLAAGVEFVAHPGFELEFEVAVLLVGHKKGVWASLGCCADDDAVLDLISGGTAFDGPPGQVPPIERKGPFATKGRGEEGEGKSKLGQGKEGFHHRCYLYLGFKTVLARSGIGCL